MRRSLMGSTLGLLLLMACDGGGSTGTNNNESIAISVASQSVDVTQAGTVTVPFTVTRAGGYAGAVTVTAEGLPAGVTAAPVTVAAGTSTGSLTLAATATAAPATGNVTLRATGTGVQAATASVSVNVRVRGTFTLQPSAAALTVQQGASATTAIKVNRAGSFGGAVVVAATAPTGITATLQPTNLVAATDSAILSVTAGAGVAAGQYAVNITGTTPGLGNQTTTVNVTVTAMPVGSYTMSITPATLQVAAGAQGNATVNLTRSNFTGAVALTATAPAGITATVAPASVTTDQASLAIAVAAGTAPGSYTVTVNGVATGVSAQSATLTVQVPQPPAADYTMSITPATLTVQAGAQGTATVNLARTNFAGAVALAATAPAGITVTAAPASVTGTQSTLTVAVAGSVAPGTYTVTVNGTATGITARSATLAVQVTQAPGFTLALNPTAGAVQQGNNTTTTVTLTRTGGFTGDVALTASGLPAGVTASFNPATLSGATTQSTLTLTASGAAAVGTAQVTVQGAATGQTSQTAAFALTVNPSQGGVGNVTWTFCGFSGIPLWVAVQDGDGAWSRVTGNANNQYTFQISSGRGGVVWVEPGSSGGFDTQAFFGTTAELQAQGNAICNGTTGTGLTVTGTASGIAAPFDLGFVTLGMTQAQLQAGQTAFTLNNVMQGSQDMIAVRQQGTFTGTAINYVPASYVIRRNLTPTNNGVLAPIDFATGTAPQQGTITFQNLGGDWSSVTTLYSTPRNTRGLLHFGADITSSTTRSWWGVPQAARQAGELHIINAIATVPTTDPTQVQTRQVMAVSENTGNITVNLGSALAAPTVSVAATAPMLRLSLLPAVQPEYDRYFTGLFSQGSDANYRAVTIFKTDAYITAGGPRALVTPDVAGVTGWNAAWQQQTGTATTWVLTVSDWTGGGITEPVLTDGARIFSATRSGQITP